MEIRNLVVEWTEVDKALQEKHEQFTTYSALKMGGMTTETKGAKKTYIDTMCMAKSDVWLAKSEAEKEEFVTLYPDAYAPWWTEDESMGWALW